MRNVTVTLDEETARWARIEAARRDTSVSRFVGALLRSHMLDIEDYERANRAYRRRFAVPIGDGQPYPGRGDIHAR